MAFSDRSLSRIPAGISKFQLPPMEVVDAVVFGGFLFLTAIFGLNLFNTRATFRSADVDVIFPTPINPRTVLITKVLRDVWITILLPLFFTIILWRPAKMGWTVLFNNIQNPQAANSVFRIGMIAYFCSALAWVWIGHGLSLWLSKPTEKIDRLRTTLSWAFALGLIGYFVLVAKRIDYLHPLESLLSTLRSPDLRGIFFLATAATNMSMAPLTNNLAQGVIGALTLVGFSVIAFLFACTQTKWLYEQATLRTNVTEQHQKLRKSGDVYGLSIQAAAKGKRKAGKWGRLQNWTVRGPTALVWKELLVLKRTRFEMFFVNLLVCTFIPIFFAYVSRESIKLSPIVILGLELFMCLTQSIGVSQMSSVENIRRIDLLKPLPFKAQTFMMVEVVNKSLLMIFAVYLGLVGCTLIRQDMASMVVAAMIFFPPFIFANSAYSMLLVVLLPDIEDPTQRAFRGLASFAGILLCSTPPVAIFALLYWLKVPIILCAIPSAALMLSIVYALTYFAGKFYEDFNPAE